MSSTANLILDAAEVRMRAGGYSDVSFRDLASDVSIKSASVHYHFPTKETLGVALVKRYAERVVKALESATGDPEASVRGIVAVFRSAARDKSTMCLCGLLGAESEILPAAVREEVARFFSWLIDWLAGSLGGGEEARTRAVTIVSSLEGAMIIAKTIGDMSVFDCTCDAILESCQSGD